jgi:hypothetical protein
VELPEALVPQEQVDLRELLEQVVLVVQMEHLEHLVHLHLEQVDLHQLPLEVPEPLVRVLLEHPELQVLVEHLVPKEHPELMELLAHLELMVFQEVMVLMEHQVLLVLVFKLMFI